jgi:hypothetical protein
MNLDIRLPLGILFLIIGGLLAAYGAIHDPLTHHGQHPVVNIDLWWGLAMAVFGLANCALAWRARGKGDPPAP